MGPKQLCLKVGRYAKRHYYELPAHILEGLTLVLLVFVQDVAFKQNVIVCTGLLFTSLFLHGLAYKHGQCKVWPKVIELAAPVPFVAMIPAAYLATVPTQKTAFITINMWFALVQVVMLLAGRNFMMDYLQDWNPKEVWGTPLLQRCAAATAAVWIVCELLMALAQGLAFAFNLSVDNGSNVGAAVFVCYMMQLLPLIFAIIFTFVYPARLKKRWGYVKGVRSTCYPPPANGVTTSCDTSASAAHRVVDMIGGESQVCLLCNSSRSSSGGGSSASGASRLCKSCSNSQQSMSADGSNGSGDLLVCVTPRDCSKQDGKRGSNASGVSSSVEAEISVPAGGTAAEEAPPPQQQQQQQAQRQQEQQQQQQHDQWRQQGQ